MFDQDTLVITYDSERGEPRGSRSKSADHKARGLGDCVDCGICVQVCPTGIDIRKGLQYECIGCAACIDGCDQVMEKIGYPKGLIRYATDNALKNHLSTANMVRRVFRPRVLAYTAILWAIIIAAGITLYHRVPVKLDVIRDRIASSRDADDREVQNVYRLQLMNTSEVARQFLISVSGIEGIEMEGVEGGDERHVVNIGPASSRMIPVRVDAPRGHVHKGANAIVFTIQSIGDDDPIVITEKASFVVQ
jgi:cytochrome c oxidase accessory protein FixG